MCAAERHRDAAPAHRKSITATDRVRTRAPARSAAGNDGRLPAIEMQHLVERLARRRPERLAGVVGGGQQHALADLRREAEQLADLPLVAQRSTTNTADSPAPGGRTSRPARYWASAGAARTTSPGPASAVGHVPQPVAALAQHGEPVRDQDPASGVWLEVDVCRVGVPDHRVPESACPPGRVGRGDQGATAGDEHPPPAAARPRRRSSSRCSTHARRPGRRTPRGQVGQVVVHDCAGRVVRAASADHGETSNPAARPVRGEPAQQVPGAASEVEVGARPRSYAARPAGCTRAARAGRRPDRSPGSSRAVGVAGRQELAGSAVIAPAARPCRAPPRTRRARPRPRTRGRAARPVRSGGFVYSS